MTENPPRQRGGQPGNQNARKNPSELKFCLTIPTNAAEPDLIYFYRQAGTVLNNLLAQLITQPHTESEFIAVLSKLTTIILTLAKIEKIITPQAAHDPESWLASIVGEAWKRNVEDGTWMDPNSDLWEEYRRRNELEDPQLEQTS